jgi:hypothetical protein
MGGKTAETPSPLLKADRATLGNSPDRLYAVHTPFAVILDRRPRVRGHEERPA